MIILPEIIENKKVILDSIKTEIKSISNDINSQNELKRKIVSYIREFVYHIDFLQLDYISDSLKNIVSYLDVSDATLDIYEALLAQVYDIRVQVKKNSDIDKYKKLIDIYNQKYEEQSITISNNVSKINTLFATSFSEVHTETENLENTLVIDEVNSQVILPYNLKDLYNLLKHDTTYNTINDAINSIYRKPLSYYKKAPVARFREAYKLIKNREHGSTKEAIDLGLELMFNGKLHPAIITSCKTLDQLDIYLSCLEYNELNDFHFFKILYKALPDAKKKKGILTSKFSGQLQKVLNQSKELLINRIPSKFESAKEVTEIEEEHAEKLNEIKAKFLADEIAEEPTDIQPKFKVTGYKTLFFGEATEEQEVIEETALFTITGYKSFKLQTVEKETIIETPVEATIEAPTTNESIDDLIDSVQDNYNGTHHTRIEKDINTVIEEVARQKAKENAKITIVKATTIRTSDNALKDKKAQEELASRRVITGARTIHEEKAKLFTITGYKSFKLQDLTPKFTITGFKSFKLQDLTPKYTITGFKSFKLQDLTPKFTITGYRIFKLQEVVKLFTITGFRTMYFGIGDVEMPDEIDIDEAIQNISKTTTNESSNLVTDVIGKLKQIQSNSKYYYEPPVQENDVDDEIEESTEELAKELNIKHENFTNRFDISKINTTLAEDPLLSAIESLDDFEEDITNHEEVSHNGSIENDRQIDNPTTNQVPEEVPLVKSIKRSRKKSKKNK